MRRWEYIHITILSIVFPFALIAQGQDSIPDYNTLVEIYHLAESHNYDSAEYAKADSLFNHIEELIAKHPGLDSSLTWVHYFLIYYERAFANTKLFHNYESINFSERALQLYETHQDDESAEGILPLIDNIYDLIATAYKNHGLIHKSIFYTKRSLFYAEKYDKEEDIIADYISIAELYNSFGEPDSLLKYETLCREKISALEGSKRAVYELLYYTSKLKNRNISDLARIHLLEQYLYFYPHADHAYQNSIAPEKLVYQAELHLLTRNLPELEALFSKNKIPKKDIQNRSDISLNRIYLHFLIQKGLITDASAYAREQILLSHEDYDVVDWLFTPYTGQHLDLIATYFSLVKTMAENGKYISTDELIALLENYENCLYAYIMVSDEDTDTYDQLSIAKYHLQEIVDVCALYQKHIPSTKLEEVFFLKLSALKAISFSRYSQRFTIHIDSSTYQSVLSQEFDFIQRISNQMDNSDTQSEYKLREEFEGFLNKLKRIIPEYYSVRYHKKKYNITTVQQTLARHKVNLLNANIGNSYAINQYLDQGKLTTTVSNLSKSFQDDISRIIEISENGIGVKKEQEQFYDIVQEYYSKSNALYQVILGDMEFNSDRALAIMSSPFLQGLNIGQLCIGNKNEVKTWADLNYLAEEVNIINLFTIEDDHVTRRIDSLAQFLYIRPRYVHNAKLGSEDYIKRLLEKFNGTSLSGTLATVENFEYNFGRYNIIHFAGHSESHISRPEQSSIILSGERGEEVLRGDEIVLLKSHASLLFLSSCNSYGKKIHVSEGVTGLARYFAFTGILNVISTQWSVQDVETQEFATTYYENILDGQNLRDAYSNMIRSHLSKEDPVLSHPYYWAGYNFHGYGDEKIIEKGFWGIALWQWSLIAVGLLLLLLWVRSRRSLM